MKQRDYAIALVVPLAVVAILAHPVFDRMQGLSVDVLFWLRNWSSPPHLESAQWVELDFPRLACRGERH